MVMALGLSACWPAPGQNADRTGHNPFETEISPATVGSLGESWSARLDTADAGSPVLSAGRVHVTDGNALYGLSAATGARQWKTALTDFEPGFLFTVGTTFVDGDRVGVSLVSNVLGGGGTLSLVDAATGAVEQTIEAGHVQSVRSPAAAAVSTFRGTDITPVASLVHVDLATGTTSGGGLLYEGFAPEPQLTAGRDRIYGSGPGVLGPFGTIVVPVPGGPPLVFPTFDHLGDGVRSFELEGGRSCVPTFVGAPPPPDRPWYECGAWATALDGATSAPPVIGPDESTVYVGTDAGTMYALDAATGAVRWSAPVGSGIQGPPALADGVLYVAAGAGELVALDAEGCGAATCAPRWTAATGGPMVAQPAVAGGVVFTAAQDGTLRAFDAGGCAAEPCEALWSAETGSAITGSPAVSGGHLLVGTADGRLISYGVQP